jgi:hypothetical protein
MRVKQYIDLRLMGIIGSVLLIISQFVAWFSGLSLLTIFIWTTSVAIEDSFLFLFPLISGSICLIGTLLILYDYSYKINSVIINFIGLGFFLIFIFELFTQNFPYVMNAGMGFYLSITGGLLILLDVLNILLQNKEPKEGNQN